MGGGAKMTVLVKIGDVTLEIGHQIAEGNKKAKKDAGEAKESTAKGKVVAAPDTPAKKVSTTKAARCRHTTSSVPLLELTLLVDHQPAQLRVATPRPKNKPPDEADPLLPALAKHSSISQQPYPTANQQQHSIVLLRQRDIVWTRTASVASILRSMTHPSRIHHQHQFERYGSDLRQL